MLLDSSATRQVAPALSSGLGWGLLGVLAFSFTMPMTRLVVDDGAMSPLFVGAGRAVVAGLLAAAALFWTGQRPPRAWARPAVVASGVVFGFPLLTSYALQTAPASHGAVVVALLPAATAVAVVLRTGERPPAVFWAAAGLGAVCAVGFAAAQNGGVGALHRSDLFLFGAVVAGAFGYAEGGLLARELGAWQTISWALVLSLPVMLLLTLRAGVPTTASPVQWAAFAYLGVISMFLGFFAWYRGLAIGPMAQVSQVQLTQPVMTIAWAALLLGEHLTWATLLGGPAVILCALLAVRTRR